MLFKSSHLTSQAAAQGLVWPLHTSAYAKPQWLAANLEECNYIWPFCFVPAVLNLLCSQEGGGNLTA